MKKVTAALLAALSLLFLVSGCQSRAAREFEELAAQISPLIDDFRKTLSQAENLLAETDPEDLKDPSLLEELQEVLKSAGELQLDLPQMPKGSGEIESATAQMRELKENIEEKLDEINQLMEDIRASIAAKKQELFDKAMTFDSYTATNDYPTPYIVRLNWKIGPFIKGSDTEVLEYVWAALGFTGDIQTTLAKLTIPTAAFIFGTYRMENASEGIGLPDNFYYTDFISINAPRDEFGNYGPLTSSIYKKAIISGLQAAGKMDMQNDYSIDFHPSVDWGEVPFFFAIANAFTSDEPDGEQMFDDIRLFMLGDYVAVRKHWDL